MFFNKTTYVGSARDERLRRQKRRDILETVLAVTSTIALMGFVTWAVEHLP